MALHGTDGVLGPGSEALAGKVAHQIEGLASMEVLKPLIQALLPYAQKEPPAHAGVPSLSALSKLM